MEKLFSRQTFRAGTRLFNNRLTSTPVLIHQSKFLARHVQPIPQRQMKCFSTSSRMFSSNYFECINIQDSEDFNSKVLQSSKPVIVDFHATWCGPCKLLGPRLETIVSEKKGEVVLAKVDIDEISDLAIDYGVKSVPTVISFINGKKQDSFIGLKEDDQIQTFVDNLVS